VHHHPEPDMTFRIIKSINRDRYLYLLVFPLFTYYLIFHYLPMYGVIIAFKDFYPLKGILGSPWVGLKWLRQFFESIYFVRLIRNTFLLGFYNLLFGFPAPIIFALLVNELRENLFKRFIQTVSYMPYFISTVVVIGIMVNLLSPNSGVMNTTIRDLGYAPINFLNSPYWFRTLYVVSSIWQHFGYSSIIYLAALSSIDVALYEAAIMDGANRWQQLLRITLPSLVPTVVILLILNIGNIMNIGFEKAFLMLNPANLETGDVITTYVYRRGLQESQYSFGAAAGLVNSVVNLILLLGVNMLSRKMSDTSLW
jgi:putative aldouronate transport system permease protein